jgi:hypothetical protein
MEWSFGYIYFRATGVGGKLESFDCGNDWSYASLQVVTINCIFDMAWEGLVPFYMAVYGADS